MSMRLRTPHHLRRRHFALVRRPGLRLACAVIAVACVTKQAMACVGDCNGDGAVTVDELVLGVKIDLGTAAIDACPAFDADDNGAVTVDELLSGVNAALTGCAATPTSLATVVASATPMPSATPTETATPTITGTPTETLTPTPNLPPELPATAVYRAFAGYPIQLPIGASDPDGDALSYAADALPDGAQLDSASGVFSWTPAADQLGPFYVPFNVSDSGLPTQSVSGQLVFAVAPPDACRTISCDPASGCTSTLPLPALSCCNGVALTRVAEPVSDCPGARVVFAGRNSSGFGKLQDCDQLPLVNFAQMGANLRINVETRCLRTDDAPVTVHARLESASLLHSLVTDDDATVNMVPGPAGYAQRLQQGVQVKVRGGGPYFDLEGVEANLTVTVTDFDGVSATQSVRVLLTFVPQADLPETP